MLLSTVALRKESVDRNSPACFKKIGRLLSLSARRAWIEIIGLTYDGLIASVALRKESVDRNFCEKLLLLLMKVSLSARRAWIEIQKITSLNQLYMSLSARRAWIEIRRLTYQQGEGKGRSPQGERG